MAKSYAALWHVPTPLFHTILTREIGGVTFLKSRKLFFFIIALVSIVALILAREPEEEHIMVRIEGENSSMLMPAEEYMLGEMAAVTDPEYEIECQKALAVLIRGNLEKKRNLQEKEISTDESFCNFFTRRRMYGANQQQYEEKLQRAIMETSGLIAVSGNYILEGNYHAVSAGATRNAKDSDSVSCDKSMEAADFFYQKEIKKQLIDSLTVEKRDTAGYVETMKLDGKVVSGEFFREKFDLPSANFDIEETEDAYLITTRGKGHGLGMDIYYANELAKQGYNYNQILNYFFKDFILKKIIV